MATWKPRTLLAAGWLSCLALVACGKQSQDQMGWARAALERNPHLEIEASDPQSRTFTVKNRDTGEISIVNADQLTAAPTGAPAMAAATSASAVVPAATTAEAQAPAPSEPAAAPAEPAPPAAPPEPPEPKVFASKALHAGSSAPPVPGQVLEAGPGYTIEAGSAPTAAAAAHEPGAGNVAIEYRHEPIVCQGARLLHIDNRNLQFEGDAVSAEDGCEIHITNSRIRATGVGVSARAANVHIDNSLIEGDAASIDASNGAQIYTVSSRFRGLSRQLDTAAVHDLGGNVWN